MYCTTKNKIELFAKFCHSRTLVAGKEIDGHVVLML